MAGFDSIALWNLPTVQIAISKASIAFAGVKAREHARFLGVMGRYSHVESPIEAVFWVWWNTIELRDFKQFACHLEPQHHVAGYRLDFAIPEAFIAIELDGHDFHERTKEQVESRNARDRDLQSLGWMVFHFSGSELLRSPIGAVLSVIKSAESRLRGDK